MFNASGGEDALRLGEAPDVEHQGRSARTPGAVARGEGGFRNADDRVRVEP